MASDPAESDLSAYITAVRAHWIAAVVTWVGLAGVVFGGDLAGVFEWNVAAGIAVLLAGLMVAQFRAWNDVRKDRDGYSGRLAAALALPVKPEHAAKLRETATRLSSSIANNEPCDYGDDIRLQAFRSHFPALVADLADWDVHASQHKAAWNALEQKFPAELFKAELEKPPFQGAGVMGMIRDATRKRAVAGTLDEPYTFAFGEHDDWVTSGPTGGTILLYTEGLDADQTAECLARIRSYFLAAQQWPETLAAALTKSTLAAMWIPLAHQLQVLAQSQDIFGRCNLCDPQRSGLYGGSVATP